MGIGDIIKVYRVEHDLSLRDFAEKCDLSHAYIAKLEAGIDSRSGKPVEPTAEVAGRIAAAMGITLDELLRRSGYTQEPGMLELEELLQREVLAFQGELIDEEDSRGILEFLRLVRGLSAKRARKKQEQG